MSGTGTRVGVVGGGLIGLSIAWRCAQRGLRVRIYDSTPAGGAGRVAAGMLAPASEAHFGEERLRELLVESARRWPDFAAELQATAGIDVGYRDEGTLLVALTEDDLRAVERLCGYYGRAGLRVQLLGARELREREPLLSPRMRGGAYAPGDHQVDPRLVLAALLAVAEGAGVEILRSAVTDLSTVEEDVIVVAAGTGSATLVGLPVRPVKGQAVRLRASQPSLRHVLRGQALGRPVYVVPRHDGELVVGATEEERGGDTTVTAGGVLDLLRPAAELLPEIAEYALVETSVGLRPGTPDNAPLLGSLRPGVVVATGHYRHGVLLTPVTADAIAELVATGVAPALIAPFAPDRFQVTVST
jgi:glycine oxidase